jgi:hypothetical protein
MFVLSGVKLGYMLARAEVFKLAMALRPAPR